MTCSELEAALKTVTEDVYHLAAPERLTTDYLTWHEYGVVTVYGDDQVQLRISQVQIDAFSQDDSPLLEHPFFVSILDTLDGLGLPWSLEDYSYDPDAAAVRMIVQTDVA